MSNTASMTDRPQAEGVRRRLAVALALVVACAGGVGCGSGGEGNDRGPRKQAVKIRVGDPAPELEFVLADGAPGKLADYGGRVVLLEFWASWCVNCKATMEELQGIRDEHPDWGERVEVLAVSIDDKREAAEAALGRRGWTGTSTAWIDPAGGKNPQLNAFVGEGIPAAYVIDGDGIVRQIGHPAQTDHAGVIDRILAAPSAGSP